MGKGLYDLDAFGAALAARPGAHVLSHDLFEGLHARTALVSDVELFDDYAVECSRRHASATTAGSAATG